MAKLTRKQREMQQREAQILAVARELFVAEGYHGLSMERIAAELEYAKGTIYNHFPNKEEIMIALSNAALQKRTGMFRRAAAYHGSSRDRLTAIGAANELFVLRFPNHFRVEQLIRSTSIWDKTSEKRRSTMLMCESQCMETVAGVVRDAVASGEVTLCDEITAEDFVFGLWSMGFGAFSIISTSQSLPEIGIMNPYEALRRNMNVLIDGLGWRPLSHERDYLAMFDQIQREMFPEETAQLQGSAI